MQCLASNGHVICNADVYGGTYRYLTRIAQSNAVSVTFGPTVGTDIRNLMQQNTKMVWIESPSNPTLTLTDIQAVAEVAHKRDAIMVVDNTLLSPYLQNPLELGADLVVHSVTKYINGHSVSLVPARYR